MFRNLAKRASKLYLMMRDEYDPMLEEHRVLDKTLARLRGVAEEMVGRLALQKAKAGR